MTSDEHPKDDRCVSGYHLHPSHEPKVDYFFHRLRWGSVGSTKPNSQQEGERPFDIYKTTPALLPFLFLFAEEPIPCEAIP